MVVGESGCDVETSRNEEEEEDEELGSGEEERPPKVLETTRGNKGKFNTPLLPAEEDRGGARGWLTHELLESPHKDRTVCERERELGYDDSCGSMMGEATVRQR